MLSFVACTDTKNDNNDKAEPTETVTEKATEQEKETEPSTEAETEPATEEPENEYIYLEDMVGVSLPDVFEEGYQYLSYYNMDDEKEYFFDVKMDNADSDTMKLIKKLDGKTVKELFDNDISIGYFLNDNDEYTFFTLLGTVQVNFQIEGGSAIIKKYESSDNSTVIEDMKEIHALKLSEVELDGITYTLKVNEPVKEEVLTDLDSVIFVDETEPTEAPDPTLPTEPEKTPSTILKDYTVAEFYYTPIPEDYIK